jgi:hypothetical protein
MDVGHLACMGDMRNGYEVLVRDPAGKRHLGGLRRKLKDKIRIDVREMGWEGVDWMHLAQGRDQWRAVGNSLMNL